MLRFEIHRFHLNRTHYLLLPKLNGMQMQRIASRLGKLGQVMRSSDQLSVKLKAGMVHVDPAGLCWSLIDPSDAMLPIIPDALSCPKAVVSPGRLQSKYFRTRTHGKTTEVHLRLRLESCPLWRNLRVGGFCALSPDEHTVATFLMRRADRSCEVLTDYPKTSASVRVFGKREYYLTEVDAADAVSRLRMSGMKTPRNSYLPEDATLRFGSAPQFSRREWADLSDTLGEWCFFSVG